jgi:hypothetical protein
MSALAALAITFSVSALSLARWSSLRRRKARRAIDELRKLQRLLRMPHRYREATLDDAALLARVPDHETAEASRHVAPLGSVILEFGESREACRVFVDSDRTTLLLVSSTLAAESHGQSLTLATRRHRIPFSLPPTVLQRVLSESATVAEILGAHRELISSHRDEPLRRFQTLADALDAWQAAEARRTAWREAQDVDELFQKDLQLLLGPKAKTVLERFGPVLRAELPQAKTRSVR